MSMLGAVGFLNDTPLKAPSLSLPTISIPTRLRSLSNPERSVKKELKKQRSEGQLNDEDEPLLDTELDTFENYVASPAPSILEIDPSWKSRKLRYERLSKLGYEVNKKKRLFSPWNTYEYSPLAPNSIRLLRFVKSPVYASKQVAFELHEVSLFDPPEYEALSYRWLSMLAACKVNCDGRVLCISSNCNSALKSLNVEGRRLWVDAICINQQDDEERGSQVSLMGEIYSKATHTIAWLGEDTGLQASVLEDMNPALEYLLEGDDSRRTFVPARNSIIPMLRDENLRPSAAFSNLLRRSWFSRIWILQEVALAKDIWICCGSALTDWTAFSAVLMALRRKSNFSKDFRAALNLVSFRAQYQKRKDSGGIDIYEAMVQARQCDVSILSDKVYGLFGVCPQLARSVGKPDYSLDFEIVWTRAQRACLRTDFSINTLSLVSSPNPGSLPISEDLPSWVADLSTGRRTWSRPRSPVPEDGIALIFDCQGLDGRCLHAWGTIADSLAFEVGNTYGNSITDNLRLWRRWWDEFVRHDQSDDRGSADKKFAFWSTLSSNCRQTIPRGTRINLWHSKILEDSKSRPTTQFITALPSSLISDIAESTSTRTFGITLKGTIGLFPNTARVGDSILLFSGGTTPYLVRRIPKYAVSRQQQNVGCLRQGAIVYQLIGPCYVYELMESEEAVEERLDEGEINIF